MRKLTAIICFFFPVRLSYWLLNLLGHSVHASAKIGFSLVRCTGKITLQENARVGHLNFIKVKSLYMGPAAYIGRLNKLEGPVDVVLEKEAAIGNNNKCYRAPAGVSYGTAVLKLGILSKITGNHRLDCMRSITMGNYSILAGHDSQLWTHGYQHDSQGPGRFRVDGEIAIGNNVYIGSRCIITGGVTIADAVVVGAGSAVARSLLQAGTYVNQPLRYIASTPAEDRMAKLKKIEGHEICEPVYQKKNRML